MNLAVGQGDLLASPLQMAVAYAALGNGGYVVTPHLGLRHRQLAAARWCRTIDRRHRAAR